MSELERLPEKIIGNVLEIIDSTPTGLIPAINGLVTNVRLNRFQKRIALHEKEIKHTLKMISRKDYDFFVEKIGGMVFEKVLKDQEDEKAEFLILGFANCVKNKIKKEDKIIMYFDLLSNLRCYDLKRLITIAEKTNETLISRPTNFDEEILTMNSDYKLKRNRLIDADTTWNRKDGEIIDYRKPVTLTNVGRDFINFIGLIEWE